MERTRYIVLLLIVYPYCIMSKYLVLPPPPYSFPSILFPSFYPIDFPHPSTPIHPSPTFIPRAALPHSNALSTSPPPLPLQPMCRSVVLEPAVPPHAPLHRPPEGALELLPRPAGDHVVDEPAASLAAAAEGQPEGAADCAVLLRHYRREIGRHPVWAARETAVAASTGMPGAHPRLCRAGGCVTGLPELGLLGCPPAVVVVVATAPRPGSALSAPLAVAALAGGGAICEDAGCVCGGCGYRRSSCAGALMMDIHGQQIF